jgi:hypothetical protein
MSSNADHERAVVLELIRMVKLDLDPNTLESRKPPEPDVYAVSASEGPLYFELGRLLDQGIQKLRLEGFRRAWAGDPTPVSMSDERVGVPERDMLKQMAAQVFIRGVARSVWARRHRSSRGARGSPGDRPHSCR